jgi:RNA-splicing ligase RtcB
MNTKDFIRLGIPLGEATRRATDFVSRFILAGGDKTRLEQELKAIIANPSALTEDSLRGELAKALLLAPPPPRAEPVKYRQWGEGLEHEAVMQMERACLLPVAVAGALMPDAHVGYGLPIGGVLATEDTVIPGVEKEVIAHRKGATPAGQGVLGIIPGSMASPGFVVSGKGNPESLNSASHGAGRVMSRTQATKTFEWKKVNAFLREKGVTLISAGLDEVPMVYKNIHEVMAAQHDLVTILGQFDPKLVKMAPHGERAED